jgi:hypothetical protein
VTTNGPNYSQCYAIEEHSYIYFTVFVGSMTWRSAVMDLDVIAKFAVD